MVFYIVSMWTGNYHQVGLFSVTESIVETMVQEGMSKGDKEKYMAVTRPKFPDAFESLKKFTSDCVNSRQKVKVVMSVVDVISPEEIEASRKLAESLGAELRVRSYDS